MRASAREVCLDSESWSFLDVGCWICDRVGITPHGETVFSERLFQWRTRVQRHNGEERCADKRSFMIKKIFLILLLYTY